MSYPHNASHPAMTYLKLTTSAFVLLVEEVVRGERSKVDALAALSERTVLVPIWGSGGFRHADGREDNFRLVSSFDVEGEHALCLFTSYDELARARRLLAWTRPGRIDHEEVEGREALRYAVEHRVEFVGLNRLSFKLREVEAFVVNSEFDHGSK